ncbi:hypothetical protein DQ04_11411000 [Trypanosoma grayi]|uniref:hypothetical protein n=1 Tax=Trypanosoma grayi TaxID=71804 RepID=UPI0004F4A0A0|nr:hypothetical protein DQ04_11411000 [Trypanosoma grayi]KEG06975.1 hypothetical protein DQ04_11411000 [Trypanosoma grayi]
MLSVDIANYNWNGTSPFSCHRSRRLGGSTVKLLNLSNTLPNFYVQKDSGLNTRSPVHELTVSVFLTVKTTKGKPAPPNHIRATQFTKRASGRILPFRFGLRGIFRSIMCCGPLATHGLQWRAGGCRCKIKKKPFPKTAFPRHIRDGATAPLPNMVAERPAPHPEPALHHEPAASTRCFRPGLWGATGPPGRLLTRANALRPQNPPPTIPGGRPKKGGRGPERVGCSGWCLAWVGRRGCTVVVVGRVLGGGWCWLVSSECLAQFVFALSLPFQRPGKQNKLALHFLSGSSFGFY